LADGLSSVLSLAVLVFSATSMLSVGFSYTLREIIEPLRNLRGVLLALAANFVVVPALAYGVSELLSLEPAVRIGLLLAAAAAGAPFLFKLTQIAEGDTAFAAGLLVLLLVVTIVYMPIVVPLIAPAATVNARVIATPLVLTMLFPLGIGLLVDFWFEPLSHRLLPIMNKVSSLALVIVVAMTVLTNFESLLSMFGTGAILAALLVIGGAFVAGYLLGAARRDRACNGPAQYRGRHGGRDAELRRSEDTGDGRCHIDHLHGGALSSREGTGRKTEGCHHYGPSEEWDASKGAPGLTPALKELAG
jgi:predicted Na+-dependent transporter